MFTGKLWVQFGRCWVEESLRQRKRDSDREESSEERSRLKIDICVLSRQNGNKSS